MPDDWNGEPYDDDPAQWAKLDHLDPNVTRFENVAVQSLHQARLKAESRNPGFRVVNVHHRIDTVAGTGFRSQYWRLELWKEKP